MKNVFYSLGSHTGSSLQHRKTYFRNNNIILILAEDEQLSPTFEEIILINVLDLVDKRLLDCVRYHYFWEIKMADEPQE